MAYNTDDILDPDLDWIIREVLAQVGIPHSSVDQYASWELLYIARLSQLIHQYIILSAQGIKTVCIVDQTEDMQGQEGVSRYRLKIE